mmetsp:Transcript_3796/g.5819  ORF Transcript_3796/g.5819 Transcript_3796/m.5819 type:complete len:400 (-) Transcript_3796:43-1242(-)
MRTLFLSAIVLIVSVSAQSWVLTNKNFASILLGVSCISPEHCWIAGNALNSKNMVWQTTDSGDNWVETHINTLSVFLLSCAADNSSEVIASGIGLIDIGEGSGYATDGENFEQTTGDRVCQSQDSGHVDTGEFYRVGHWTHSHTSGDKKGNGVSWSDNKGESYDHFDWGQESNVRYGSFLSRDFGYLSGGNFPTDDSDEDIRDLLSLPKDGFYKRLSHRVVIGSNGKLAHTPIRAGVPDNLPVGFYGDIAKTEDGGKTWTNVFHTEGNNSSSAFYFNGIKCTTKDDCYVTSEGVDSNGEPIAYVWQTADGGSNWNCTLTLKQGSLIGIDVIGQSIWVFGGNVETGHGQVWTSSNNGKTWNTQADFPNSYMMWGDMVDDSHGFCVGEEGFGQEGAIWHFS